MPNSRIIIDTNILISAAFGPKSQPAQALEYARLHEQLIISPALFDEYKKLLSPKFDAVLPRLSRMRIIECMRYDAEWVDHNLELAECRDPKDDMVLSLAVAGEVDFVLTGDKDLLIMNPFEGVEILTARTFLERLS